MVLVLALPFAAYLVLDWNLGPPIQVFRSIEYNSIITVHAISVAALTAFVGLVFASILSERKRAKAAGKGLRTRSGLARLAFQRKALNDMADNEDWLDGKQKPKLQEHNGEQTSDR